jgi:hypothetical protein
MEDFQFVLNEALKPMRDLCGKGDGDVAVQDPVVGNFIAKTTSASASASTSANYNTIWKHISTSGKEDMYPYLLVVCSNVFTVKQKCSIAYFDTVTRVLITENLRAPFFDSIRNNNEGKRALYLWSIDLGIPITASFSMIPIWLHEDATIADVRAEIFSAHVHEMYLEPVAKHALDAADLHFLVALDKNRAWKVPPDYPKCVWDFTWRPNLFRFAIGIQFLPKEKEPAKKKE